MADLMNVSRGFARGVFVATALAACLGVSACGKKGALEAPSAETGSNEKTAASDKSSPAPHKPYILDGLLR